MIRDKLSDPNDSEPGLQVHASAKPVTGGIVGPDMGRGDRHAAPLGFTDDLQAKSDGSLERKADARGAIPAGKDGGEGCEPQTAANRRAGSEAAATSASLPAAARFIADVIEPK